MIEFAQGSIQFNEVITGAELTDKVNVVCSNLAKYLDDSSVIGLVLPRTPDLMIGILAALKLKIPFIPIDIHQPAERVQYMISEANLNIVMTTHELSSGLEFKNLFFIDDVDFSKQPDTRISGFNSQVAYILYTSGSTGNPKGVEVTWEGLENFMEGISERIDFTPGKRIACLTTVYFDIFFLESITALCKGLTVVLANEEEQRNPKLTAKFIEDNLVDIVQMTPSQIQLLLNYDKELSCLKNAKEILVGGESLPISLLRSLQEKTTAKIYNMYGPTETTIWSTVSDLTNKNSIDIGLPIKNTEIYIVDENMNILPDGQAGEICIAGKGLAKGYVRHPDLTAKSFLELPQKPGIRVYRTGDSGKYIQDGNIQCFGRIDNQVKIRGHRIELEEIEFHMNQFDGIKQSIATAAEVSDTDKILKAFFTSDTDINFQDIKDFLSLRLPGYMVPVSYKRIKGFIYTTNGKIDRKKVEECVEVEGDKVKSEASNQEMTDRQKEIFRIILANLSVKVTDQVSLDMDFSSIGLDSITFIKIIVALEGDFDFEFDDEMLILTKFSTVNTMIDYVESKIG